LTFVSFTDVFSTSHPISTNYTYKLAVIVYRSLHCQTPKYLVNHLTQPLTSLHGFVSVLLVRYVAVDSTRRAFSIAGQTVWNSLADQLRDPTRGSDSFKQRLKAILFNFY